MSAWRVGKWRRTVADPTPASRAIFSEEASAPRAATSARATSRMSVRFRRASARSESVIGPLPVANWRDPPYRVEAKWRAPPFRIATLRRIMSLDTAPVLVTGATGKQGGAVVRALVAAGIPVRALTRDARRGEEVREDGADLAVGDLDDADSVVRAVAGVRGVFSVQMPRMSNSGLDYDGEVRQAESLIKAARAAGVTHFVQSSISGVGQQAKVPGYCRQDWGDAS